jgi:hypothetical protein
MTIKYPAIPYPVEDLASLRSATAALKEVVEIITQQRGSVANSAVTWQDLVNLGLITTAQVPVRLTSG